MGNNFSSHQNFSKARNKARMQSLMATLSWKENELLSFYEVTKLLKPKAETYRGFKAIEIDKIVGSENRYHDFTLAFYPRKDMLRSRWQRIDQAHLNFIHLPPISVYQLGECYFVRDGNHRVSVAKAQGIEFIDAEVVELDSEIELEPNITKRKLIKKVVEYERSRFLKLFELDRFIDMNLLKFSAPGMYPEIINHINVHKYFINQSSTIEISFEEAAHSWYEKVFLPIVNQVKEDKILSSFPGRSYGDLYLWIVRHWDNLKHGLEEEVTIQRATKDFIERFRPNIFKRLKERFKAITNR
jgi:hypothetical protein